MKNVSKKYSNLSIHQKINSRDNRNWLNINWLFNTNLNDFNMGFTQPNTPDTDQPRRPRKNAPKWGIYHK